MDQAYTPVTNPVVSNENPLGAGKVYDAPVDHETGKTEIFPGTEPKVGA